MKHLRFFESFLLVETSEFDQLEARKIELMNILDEDDSISVTEKLEIIKEIKEIHQKLVS